LVVVPLLGLATAAHAVPFHLSTKVRGLLPESMYEPTAVHAVAETHDTPLN
jgi:hypothetical protein